MLAAGGPGAFYTIGMRPVCFLSDFGLADDFVGTCKGVMHGIAPGVSVVDLTHEVPDFGVEVGAELLEHATVHGNNYGVPREPVRRALQAGQDVLLKIDVQGAETVKHLYPDAVLIFLLPPSVEA